MRDPIPHWRLTWTRWSVIAGAWLLCVGRLVAQGAWMLIIGVLKLLVSWMFSTSWLVLTDKWSCESRPLYHTTHLCNPAPHCSTLPLCCAIPLCNPARHNTPHYQHCSTQQPMLCVHTDAHTHYSPPLHHPDTLISNRMHECTQLQKDIPVRITKSIRNCLT